MFGSSQMNSGHRSKNPSRDPSLIQKQSVPLESEEYDIDGDID